MYVNSSAIGHKAPAPNLPLLLLAASVVGGQYLLTLKLGGFALFGFRIFPIMLVAGYLLSNRQPRIENTAASQSVLWVFFAWLMWGVGSGLWAPALSDWGSDIFNIASGLLFLLALLLATFDSSRAILQLRFYWVLAYLAAVAIAMVERKTGMHLRSTWSLNAGLHALAALSQSTFGNPNNFAAYAVLSAPLALWGALDSVRHRRVVAGFFYAGAVATIPVVLFMTASRLAMAAFGLQLLALWVLSSRVPRLFLLSTAILVVMGAYGARTLIRNPIIAIKMIKAPNEIANANGSIGARIKLSLAGLWMVGETAGLGVGAGGFTEMVDSPEQPYGTSKLTNAHNYWIEIASQYGLLVTALVFGCVFLLGFSAFRMAWYAWTDPGGALPFSIRSGMMMAPLMWLTYCIVAVTHSSFITNHVNWSSFALLTVLLSRFELYYKKRELHGRPI